jgi:catechol 2,3-dioxygenase-like lactoylglutathione lyase family enzyme/predicted enzyme related to lactoylglutathione lyase
MAFVQRFDHFVVPADDLVAVEEFYLSLFGCKVAIDSSGRVMRFGLTVRQRRGGMPPHTFFEIAGKRIGIFLQDEQRAKPDSVYGAPAYMFETTADGIKRMAAVLRARKLAYEFPAADPSFACESLLLFNDPAGNHFEVFVPREDDVTAASDDTGLVTAVGHLRLEAPNLERSIKFYCEILGLGEASLGRNARLNVREATLALPSGQRLILTEIPFSPKGLPLSREIGGPHIAFDVADDDWERLMRHLLDHGIEHGDRYTDLRARSPQDRDTYVEDPAGYVLQLASEHR